MAFNRTLLVPMYVATDAPGALIAIQDSSVVTLNIEEQVDSASLTYCRKKAFVWKGNFYIPYGNQFSSNYGWVGYKDGKYTGMLGWDTNSGLIIPVGDKIAMFGYQDYGYGISPFKMVKSLGSFGNTYPRDWAVLGDKVYVINAANYLWEYQYPFNLAASTIGPEKIWYLCVFKGALYGIDIQSYDTLQLWKLTGASWAQIGTDYVIPSDINMNENSFSNGFFEFNDKLWFVIQNQLGRTRIRCWEINEATGVFTEHASDVPAALKTTTQPNASPINVVIDDIGDTRQVFLLIYTPQAQPGGWELWEFKDGAQWTLVNSGAQKFGPYCHVLWDDESTGAEILGATQDPAGHVDLEVHTGDLKYNSTASIDPRYADAGVTTEHPPYNVCTEMTGVGSEGKTGLSTKPTGITALTHLSDDWGDSVLDEDLWEEIDYGMYSATLSRDHGIGYGYYINEKRPVESSGYVRFPTSSTYPTNVGCGLMNKWLIEGAFSVEVSLIGIAQMYAHNTDYVKLMLYAKISQHKGFGIFVRRNGSLVVHAKSFCFQQDVSPAHISAASTHVVADGEKMKISRDGSNVWSAVIDPDGDNETLDCGYAPGYSDEVQLFLLLINHGSADPCTGDPGPGFGPISVSGAGSLGKYTGAVEHQFSWDAINDVGAGFLGTVNLFVDPVI